MKIWIVSTIISLLILTFFPEPQINFLAYLLTAIFLVILNRKLYKELNHINITKRW